MFGVWFPIMTFVAIDSNTWLRTCSQSQLQCLKVQISPVLQFIQNMGTVFLGNFVGAVTLVSALYTFAYKK